jgi:hypothetical protein
MGEWYLRRRIGDRSGCSDRSARSARSEVRAFGSFYRSQRSNHSGIDAVAGFELFTSERLMSSATAGRPNIEDI